MGLFENQINLIRSKKIIDKQLQISSQISGLMPVFKRITNHFHFENFILKVDYANFLSLLNKKL